MNDGKEMKGNRGFAIAIAVMMLMMVVQVPLSGASDDSYAASEGSAPLGNLNVVVFDQDSADYSLLAYMSDELPKQLNAAEWVYDTDTRLWYNINSLSSDYGKALRYGMISGMSVSEIRSDIIAFFTPLYIDALTVVQVEYTVNAACNISIDVDKDGNPLTWEDVIAVDDTLADDLDVKLRSARAVVIMKNELSPRERQIIAMRYGLDGRPAVTQREAAERLGISRSYVSRIEGAALKKICESLARCPM